MIRAASTADAPHIAQLERAGAGQPWSEASVAEHLALPSTLALVCAQGHILTAVIAGEAEVLSVVVHPDARRQGLGRQLMQAARAAWAERGVERAFLEVRRDNVPAIALYEGLGWTRAGERRAYYRDGTDALVYVLELR